MALFVPMLGPVSGTKRIAWLKWSQALRTMALPSFHLNALGVRVGKKIGFFFEAGVGYKGMLSVGIDGQF